MMCWTNGWLEYPAGFDGSAIVAHGRDMQSAFVGGRTEQGSDGGPEETVVSFPCLFRVR